MADSRAPAARAARAQLPWVLAALLPGAITVYFAFNAGGFFAGEPAAVATVLLLILATRIMLAADPAAGITRGLLVAAAALGGFALWTLLSGTWSHAHGRALIEADRALLYLVALVLFGSLAGGGSQLRWMIRGVGLALVVVCAISLTARLLPDVWPIAYESLARRLEYPITYSNALGLLAAVGVILCFGMTSSEREPRVVRVLACGAIPLLASTLVFTLSRGGILAAVIGLVTFAVAGHTRALLSGVIAGGLATAVAVTWTYRSDLLAYEDPLGRAARDQGETLAIVVVLCVVGAMLVRALLLRLDAALAAAQPARDVRRRLLIAGVVAVTAVLAAATVAVDLPRQYDRFVNAEPVTALTTADPRARLSTPRSSERLEYWRVAYGQFERTPVRGSGAGTYEFAWDQHRPRLHLVRDAHSLYLEALSDLGLVGFGLIALAILVILVGIALRIRGPNRGMYATVFAAALAWAIIAGIDWHWEMAVVSLWFFAVGGAALARDGSRASLRGASLWMRTLMAGACCGLALLGPLRVGVSQNRLEASLSAFTVGRCDVAGDAARESLRAVGSRPQPYEILAYCALIDGKPALAVTRMGDAVRHDPGNWRLRYGLARMRAMAGRDPRGPAREALRLNPLEALTQDAVERLGGLQRPQQWRRAAQGMEIILPDP